LIIAVIISSVFLTVPNMTYNVFGGMLYLAQLQLDSFSISFCFVFWFTRTKNAQY